LDTLAFIDKHFGCEIELNVLSFKSYAKARTDVKRARMKEKYRKTRRSTSYK